MVPATHYSIVNSVAIDAKKADVKDVMYELKGSEKTLKNTKIVRSTQPIVHKLSDFLEGG